MTRPEIEALIASAHRKAEYTDDQFDNHSIGDLYRELAAALRELLEENERLTELVADREASIKDCHTIAKDAEIKAFGLLEEAERLRGALNYVADMTFCGVDAEWHFKPGYDPQAVLDALETTHD